jgi:hypothetical protein
MGSNRLPSVCARSPPLPPSLPCSFPHFISLPPAFPHFPPFCSFSLVLLVALCLDIVRATFFNPPPPRQFMCVHGLCAAVCAALGLSPFTLDESRAVAFAMVTHDRLGKQSKASALPCELVERILRACTIFDPCT